MTVIRRLTMGLLLFCTSVFAVTQSTPYILTEFPITLLKSDTAVWLKWTGATRNPTNPDLIPDSGRVYFSTSPGGSVIENYTDSVTKRVVDTIIRDQDTSYVPQDNILFKGNPPQRGIKFRPGENNMRAGVYYVMIAWRTKIGLLDTTFFSNEIKMIIESDKPVTPTAPEDLAEIENLTPTFQWENNPGVPYYHIIVSDEKIEPNLDSFTVEGLSIIWEAITANTQMIYGEPDPSGTITADPPPLSPGQEYSWVVLNNYGNHPAFSSILINMPSNFTIKGLPLKKPANVSPNGDTISANPDSTMITLKWTNLDSLANTYKAYIYVTKTFEGVTAQMVVWSTEVTAGGFTNDTGSVTLNANLVLTDNDYTWKVIAVDKKGAGTAGDISKFTYDAPVGGMRVYTKEKIEVGDTSLTKAVGLVEVKLEVLDGSLEAPLLFYTDDDGYLLRQRPPGTYKITTKKDGFVSQSKTITITENDTISETFFLKRPDATIYGKVQDKAAQAINLATVLAISDRGDTVSAETDPLGNFVLSCYEADWSIIALKEGYENSLAQEVSVIFGQSVNLPSAITLEKLSYTLSGIVKNNSDEPLLGVKVQLMSDGNVIGLLPSTPQSGAFSFSVKAGSYTISATKVGFTSYSNSIDILNSTQITIKMAAGAALIKGEIMGRSWNDSYTAIYAPITKARVIAVNTASPTDTAVTESDNVYGNFSLSVEGGKTYKLYASAQGYVQDTTGQLIVTAPGLTYTTQGTLKAFGRLKGTIRLVGRSLADLSGVTVSLYDTATNRVVVSATSDVVGSFELSGIPDSDAGTAYKIVAGRDGLVVDSIFQIDTLGRSENSDMITVSDGIPKIITTGNFIKSINVDMMSGSKAIQWILLHGQQSFTNATIKLLSPMVKNVSPVIGIGGVGTGQYTMSIDASADSIIDCAYHSYTLAVGPDSINIDTVNIPAVHHAVDSVKPVSGYVTLSVTAKNAVVDSGYVYYKEVSAQSFDSVALAAGGVPGVYTGNVMPQKDGAYMEYFFKLFVGSNIYGYKQETFVSYILPDNSTLTKVTVTPGADDTLTFPAEQEISFMFKGYYGSNFAPSTTVTAANVSWSFAGTTTCTFVSKSIEAVVATPAGGTGAAINVLQAVFVPSTTTTIKPGVKDTVLIPFKVSPHTLDSVTIARVDAGTEGFITTSGVDKAEFLAKGIDKGGSEVSVTVTWDTLSPEVGTIQNGVYVPAKNFIGRAKISATIGSVTGNFYDATAKKYGIAVQYLVSPTGDTVKSSEGCTILLPGGLVESGKQARLSMETPKLDNRIFASSTHDTLFGVPMKVKFDVVGTAYDITDVDSLISLHKDSTDSIIVALDVPSEYLDDAKAGRVYVGLWDEARAEWDPIQSSALSADETSVTIRTSHFSRYALILRSSGTGVRKFTIKPNPFSPYVVPTPEYGTNARNGTCIEVSAVSNLDKQFKSIKLSIHNVVGDVVWSARLMNATSGKVYRIWWDGKTTDREVTLTETGSLSDIAIPGVRMCRNGRYFLILKLQDSKKEKKYMKQIILFK